MMGRKIHSRCELRTAYGSRSHRAHSRPLTLPDFAVSKTIGKFKIPALFSEFCYFSTRGNLQNFDFALSKFFDLHFF